MANPHLDGGQPWGSSTVTSPIVKNQVSPGHPSGGYEQDKNPPVITQPLPPKDRKDRNIIKEGIGSLGGSLHGDEIYQPEIKNTYDVLDAMTDLSRIHGKRTIEDQPGGPTLTKYGKSWDFNPNNPDNLIGDDTHTLGNMIMTSIDPETGKRIPILDSSGNPIFTSFGKNLHDHMQDEGLIGPGQFVGDPSALQDYVDTFSFEELQDWERDYFDRNFYGMDDFDYDFYGGGQGSTEVSETFSGAPWFQKGLDEILAEGPTGFGDMQSIYGEEFNPEREASFLYLTGVPQFGDETIYDYI